jgi:hypothetical protein
MRGPLSDARILTTHAESIVTTTFVLVAALAFLIGASDFVRRARARRDIAPASDLQRHFGLYAENRPVIHLDPALVPSDLRHLIPLAEKWGIGDGIIRTDLIYKSSDSEKRELHDALYEPFERITEWLDSFAGRPLSEEAEAFMHMQGALDEMGFYISEEKRATRPPSWGA